MTPHVESGFSGHQIALLHDLCASDSLYDKLRVSDGNVVKIDASISDLRVVAESSKFVSEFLSKLERCLKKEDRGLLFRIEGAGLEFRPKSIVNNAIGNVIISTMSDIATAVSGGADILVSLEVTSFDRSAIYGSNRHDDAKTDSNHSAIISKSSMNENFGTW